MPATDASRARLITGVAAVATTALASLAVLTGGTLQPVGLWLGAAAVAASVTGVLAGWASFGALSAIALGAAFTTTRVGTPQVVDGRVVPFAVLLLIVAELVAWSAESRTARPPGVPHAVRLQRLAVASSAGAVGAIVVSAVAVVPRSSDLAIAALGVAAMAGAAVVVGALARARSVR